MPDPGPQAPPSRLFLVAVTLGCMAMAGASIVAVFKVLEWGPTSWTIDTQLGLLFALSCLALVGGLRVLLDLGASVRVDGRGVERRLGPLHTSVPFSRGFRVRRTAWGGIAVTGGGEALRIPTHLAHEAVPLELELARKELELDGAPSLPLHIPVRQLAMPALIAGLFATLAVAAPTMPLMSVQARGVALAVLSLLTVAVYVIGVFWESVTLLEGGLERRVFLRRRTVPFRALHGFFESEETVLLIPRDGDPIPVVGVMRVGERSAPVQAAALEAAGVKRLSPDEVLRLRPDEHRVQARGARAALTSRGAPWPLSRLETRCRNRPWERPQPDSSADLSREFDSRDTHSE